MDTEKPEISRLNREIIAGVLQSYGPSLGDLKSSRFDPDALWDRVDGDLDLLRDLMAVLKQEIPELLAKIEAAIQHGDAEALEKAGHKIKGSVLQFSGKAAAVAAHELEKLGRSGKVAGAEAFLRTLRQEIEFLMEALTSMIGRLAEHRAI